MSCTTTPNQPESRPSHILCPYRALLSNQPKLAGRLLAGEKSITERRCSTTELHRPVICGRIRTRDHPLPRRSIRHLRHRPNYISRTYAKPGNKRIKYQSKQTAEPCPSGQRPRPLTPPLRQSSPNSAQARQAEVTRLYHHWHLLCRRRPAAAQKSASLSGKNPAWHRWESNPTLYRVIQK